MNGIQEPSVYLDVSGVATAEGFHALLQQALLLPSDYLHDWDDLWRLVEHDYPLPQSLTIRGLDVLEARLPRVSSAFLDTIRRFNNVGQTRCATQVTEDYSGLIFRVILEARPLPTAHIQGVSGAFVQCWIKAREPLTAKRLAHSETVDAGWEVVAEHDAYRDALDEYSPDEEGHALYKQACTDGCAILFEAWEHDD